MQELHERLAGRNKDELSYIHQGLAELTRQWDVVAADCRAAARDAQEVCPPGELAPYVLTAFLMRL